MNLVTLVSDAEGGATFRYGMLETIHEFGREQLQASSERERVRAAHAAYYLTIAVRHEIPPAPWFPLDDAGWAARMETEEANIRAALDWLATAGDPDSHVRLASAIGWPWCGRGRPREACAALESAWARAHVLPPLTRARLANVLGSILVVQGDSDRAAYFVSQALALAREAEDPHSIASALATLGVIAQAHGSYDQAMHDLTEALVHAELVTEPAVAIPLVGSIRTNLGVTARGQRKFDEATAHIEAALAGYRALGSRLGEIVTLGDLGEVARDEGAFPLALERLQAALAGAWEHGNQRMVVELLDSLAGVAASMGMAPVAVRLFAASERLREQTGLTLRLPLDHAADEQNMTQIRAALGETRFADEWLSGRELSPAEAVTEALAIVWPEPSSLTRSVERSARSARTPSSLALTDREREILPFIVAGKTDREIAEALFIGRRTVESHVSRLLGKLGVTTRTAAVSAARAAGLYVTDTTESDGRSS
jgi:non-specific serine/threonine protein kinase